MSKYRLLDELGIPHEIIFNDKLVNLLMGIAECRPFFTESLSRPLKVTLITNAKVQAVTYSNQIEGNPLKEDEVGKLINKKKRQEEKSEIEMQNYSDALSFSEKLVLDPRPISISDFYDLQRMITAGLLTKKQLGKIRTIPVEIVNASTGKVIDSCPEPHHLKQALNELWMWLEETKQLNPYARAFAFHYISVAIHPFADGNGRSARLMQHLLLLRSGQEIAKYVPSETAIMRYRDEYYSSIRQTKKIKKLTPILEFLAKCFCESAEDVTREAKLLIKKSQLTTEQRRDAIVKLVKKKKEIRTRDLVEHFPDVARRSLERDFEYLCREKKIKAKSKGKLRTYVI